MLTRVDLQDVELGMFIHKLEGSWFDHPFWKSRFLLNDNDTLRDIQASDISGVIIDTSKGKGLRRAKAAPVPKAATPIQRPTPPRPAPRPALSAQRLQRSAPTKPTQAERLRSTLPLSTAREFGNAQAIVRKSEKVISKFFLEARLGKSVKVGDVEPVIEDIFASVQRNPFAFSGLMRCKQDCDFIYRHALSASALMVALGRQMKLPWQEIRDAGMAGLCWDIGVSHLPMDHSKTRGDFRDLEPEIRKPHVLLGHDMLTAAGDMPKNVIQACLQHHELMDGSGYPQGLKGPDISPLSRMAAICDAFDLLVTNGAVTPGLDPAAALRQLNERQAEFEPDILRHFIEAVGIYPIGSFVRLRTDRLAMVVDLDANNLSHPVIRTFYSLPLERRVRSETIELSNCYGKDEIVGIADLDGLVLPELSQLRDLIFIAACKSGR